MRRFLRATDDVVKSQNDPGEIAGLQTFHTGVRMLYGIYMPCHERMNLYCWITTLNLVPNQNDTVMSRFIWAHTYSTDMINGIISSWNKRRLFLLWPHTAELHLQDKFCKGFYKITGFTLRRISHLNIFKKKTCLQSYAPFGSMSHLMCDCECKSVSYLLTFKMKSSI